MSEINLQEPQRNRNATATNATATQPQRNRKYCQFNKDQYCINISIQTCIERIIACELNWFILNWKPVANYEHKNVQWYCFIRPWCTYDIASISHKQSCLLKHVISQFIIVRLNRIASKNASKNKGRHSFN